MAGTSSRAHFHDIPDMVLTTIFSLVSETRTRNAMSLVCLKWLVLERSTRKSLTLRGNIRDLSLLPTCFRAVTELDLSSVSPWGYPLLDGFPNPLLLAQFLQHAFPLVVSLVVYVRNSSTLHLLASQWPDLRHVKLVRWHPRLPTAPIGSDLVSLFEHCGTLSSLDVSHFYCWPEDVRLAIQAYPLIATSLTHLNILKYSSTEGFKSHELLAITSCPNLRKLLATCVFDPRFVGYVGDQTLLDIASNCPHLSLLHLVDTTSESNVRRSDLNHEGYTSAISHATLGDIFARLPLLEELVLDVCYNVWGTWPALELLNSKCPMLKSLKLGHFHGICQGIISRLDGVALCRGLQSLSIKNSADLTDNSLISISHGCHILSKFELLGCKGITATGMRIFTHNLRKTLVDVKISYCKKLDAVSSLQALEPIRDRIERLHIDCVWEEKLLEKKRKSSSGTTTWTKLQHLSLWIAAGESLTSLSSAGLDDCPALEEIQIKIEGDCRDKSKPLMTGFGLRCLTVNPRLSRMVLDCSGVTGYALTAPAGKTDLSLWERFFLNGIQELKINELEYWTAQDVDMNQRSLFLPAAGLLSQCVSLRKLFIHGTANEHLMMFLLGNPVLRDAQLRVNYYPATEDDTSPEMKFGSCFRFEEALNSSSRQVPD